MARPRKEIEDSMSLQAENEVEAEIKPKVMVFAPRNKVYSFEQWAIIRKRVKHHWPGMLAFLGDASKFKYSLDKWDDIFSVY